MCRSATDKNKLKKSSILLAKNNHLYFRRVTFEPCDFSCNKQFDDTFCKGKIFWPNTFFRSFIQDAPSPVRTKFEAMAKREKQKTNVPEMKFTSTGVSFAEIERRQKEQQEAIEREQKDILNKVKSKAVSGGESAICTFLHLGIIWVGNPK